MTFKQGPKKMRANFFLLVLFFVCQVAYKADYKHDIVDYNYPATLTPSYQTTMKLVPLKDVSPLPFCSFLVTSLLWSDPQAARRKETRHSSPQEMEVLRKGHSFPLVRAFIFVWKFLDFQYKVGKPWFNLENKPEVQFLLFEFGGLCQLLGTFK